MALSDASETNDHLPLHADAGKRPAHYREINAWPYFQIPSCAGRYSRRLLQRGCVRREGNDSRDSNLVRDSGEAVMDATPHSFPDSLAYPVSSYGHRRMAALGEGAILPTQRLSRAFCSSTHAQRELVICVLREA